jgi:hypothetical protein
MYNYKDVIALGLNFEMNWQITLVINEVLYGWFVQNQITLGF